MDGQFSACATITLFFILVPSIGLSIAALVIGSGDIDCDDSDAVIGLSTWLITYGSVSLGIAVMLIIGVILMACSMVAGGSLLIMILSLSTCWNLAWNVVGAVSLFAGAMDCLEHGTAMGIMTIVALAIQWLTMLQV